VVPSSTSLSAGIPSGSHGEPTIRKDLPELVGHAENLGQVSGVVTAGERLTDASRLDRLLRAGVDHLLVVVNLKAPDSLLGLKRAVEADVFCAAHLTLDARSSTPIREGLRQLKSLGVSHVSLSAPPGADGQTALRAAHQEMADLALTLVWDLPVPYASQNPIRLEESGGTLGRAWLYIEPDGDVCPHRASRPLGSVLRDLIQLWERDAQAAPAPTA
jgi:hypothetical protein